jgi:hypothetical protein
MIRPPPPALRSQKWNFYRKKWFTKPAISQNVHLGFSSNFAIIYFNKWTTNSISKTLLPSKMAAVLKMAVKNWFFDHNPVNIKYFYVLSLASCKSSYNTSFIEDFLEHIFKKMGSTEIVVSSVRLSVCLSVCLLFLSRYST